MFHEFLIALPAFNEEKNIKKLKKMEKILHHLLRAQ